MQLQLLPGGLSDLLGLTLTCIQPLCHSVTFGYNLLSLVPLYAATLCCCHCVLSLCLCRCVCNLANWSQGHSLSVTITLLTVVAGVVLTLARLPAPRSVEARGTVGWSAHARDILLALCRSVEG